MTHSPLVFSLLVAGPSDVKSERHHVILAVDEWNQLHSDTYGVHFRARGWESLRPELADGPQSIINKKLVDQCDGLIAAFGARIGSATPNEISGTVEEIKRFHGNRKTVMVYFSVGAIKRKVMDPQQLLLLGRYHDELKALGLLGEFTTANDLHRKVLADLSKLARELAEQAAKSTSPTPPEIHTSTQDRSRKACLSLASIGPIQGGPDASQITFNFRNEGESPAYDVKVTFDDGRGFPTEPDRVDIREIPPARNVPPTSSRVRQEYTRTHRVQRPRADASGEPIKDQELHIRVRATFRDGLGERDEAIFVVYCRNQGWGWKPVEDRSQAVLSPICRFVRPESRANPQPFPITRPVAFVGDSKSGLPRDHMAVLNSAIRLALKSGIWLVQAAGLSADPSLASRSPEKLRESLDVLTRRGLIEVPSGRRDIEPLFLVTIDGRDLGLRDSIVNYDGEMEHIRQTICSSESTTVAAVAEGLDLPTLLVEHIARKYQANHLLRVRSTNDRTTIDLPSPELCPGRSQDMPATPRPKQLSAIEHQIMQELVRRVVTYPTAFRASILGVPVGDNQHGYQSDHIAGTPVPSDARDMIKNDRDIVPTLIRRGFLHAESSDTFTMDDSLFCAYGYEPPS